MTNHTESSDVFLSQAHEARAQRMLPEIVNTFALLSIAHGIQEILERTAPAKRSQIVKGRKPAAKKASDDA